MDPPLASSPKHSSGDKILQVTHVPGQSQSMSAAPVPAVSVRRASAWRLTYRPIADWLIRYFLALQAAQVHKVATLVIDLLHSAPEPFRNVPVGCAGPPGGFFHRS